MWSMPRSILRVVAVLIALCAVAGFILGVLGTPEKGRLPGEVVRGAGAVPIDAPDAQPLLDAPPPRPPRADADKKAAEPKSEVDPLDAQASAVAPPPAAPAQPKPPEDKVGDLLDGVTPPPEDPPH